MLNFLRGRRESKAQETITHYSNALDSFKRTYLPIKDVVQTRSRGPEAEDFNKKFEKANRELETFLEDLFVEDVPSLSVRLSQIDVRWRGLATDLLYALREFVPITVQGNDYRIASLTAQGYLLSARDKARYIQRDIAQAIGYGSPDIQPIDHHIYTLCEEKLLHTLIVTLIDAHPRLTRKEFESYCQIFSLVFTLFQVWSHQDGPFRRFTQQNPDVI